MSKDVTAALRYSTLKTRYVDVSPRNYPKDKARVFDFHEHLCFIEDRTNYREKYSIENNGFVLIDHKSGLEYESSEKRIRALYAGEITNLLAQLIDATEIIVLNLVIRGCGSAKPLFHVHNDYNDNYAWLKARKTFSDSTKFRKSSRFDFIQTWRPINTITQNPLAICDATSIDSGDLMEFDHNYMIKFNPEHQWGYFPGMSPEQLLVFRTFSSDKSCKTRFTPHTSFSDPEYPASEFPRKSIETRAIVLYD